MNRAELVETRRLEAELGGDGGCLSSNKAERYMASFGERGPVPFADPPIRPGFLSIQRSLQDDGAPGIPGLAEQLRPDRPGRSAANAPVGPRSAAALFLAAGST